MHLFLILADRIERLIGLGPVNGEDQALLRKQHVETQHDASPERKNARNDQGIELGPRDRLATEERSDERGGGEQRAGPRTQISERSLWSASARSASS
jgi:hypothetical protein